MKKTQNSRKLNLNQETLIPLNATELEAINGGITPTIVPVTIVAASGALAGLGASVGLYRAFFGGATSQR